MKQRFAWLVMAVTMLAGCDPQHIAELEEGVATEADVRARFGEPAAIYPESDGSSTFEYPRQPEGQKNYMITIGTDGKMSALRQVLQPAMFARITPGLEQGQVRRLLGRPAQMQRYALKQQEVWDWRILDNGESRLFSVTFDAAGHVIASGVTADLRQSSSGS